MLTTVIKKAILIFAEKMTPYYKTILGKAYLGASMELMRGMASDSVNLVITSPPFGLVFKKEYGNADTEKYIEWFLPYVREMKRIIVDDGSIVIDIGGPWKKGSPTRSTYQFTL